MHVHLIFEAMRAWQRHFRSLSRADRLRDDALDIPGYNSGKKTSRFPRQLNEGFDALFKRTKNLFWFRNLMAIC